MSPGTLNPDMVTMAAVNLHGDQAFQNLLHSVNPKSLIVSGIIVGLVKITKGKKWKMITIGILAFVTFFLVTGWVVPIVTNLYGTGGNVPITGNDTLSGMMSLTGMGTLIVFWIICGFISKRMEWGVGVGIIMAFVLSITWVHWALPFWESTGISLGSIPGIG